VSVARGHYYQGVFGRRFFGRLRDVGLAPDVPTGEEDDAAFAAGVGLTDIIKRPTARATDLRPGEFKHGRAVLGEKLEQFVPQLVILTFAAAAKAVFGRFAGNGFVPGLHVGEAGVFVMPGPRESNATARPTLVDLGDWAWS
jgi:TDG/mug DNA glycosylase family protein